MEIKLLIGLGNPGKEYEGTYHNIGHLFVDALAGKTTFKKGRHFIYAKTGQLILVKTATFMNHSGVSVASAKSYFKCKPSEILVVHDDSDLFLGDFKISFARGSAGHGGINSVIKSLRTNKFYRLRIGVRPPKEANLPAEARRAKAGELVLKKIPASDKKNLLKLFKELQVNGKGDLAAGLRQNA